ncbi:hypothetical protein QBC38DRAFT_461016 [Podospora fimiseda]|uniref:CorA-like transporter domain-containing protein n=1 Tax=Podospora fimiseda TaxID=252190 RepID=A0AAN6YNQ2_9PEZI|nr:hypothetical protein QBC38DRAFT_461016 [Podospora fimiseda]
MSSRQWPNTTQKRFRCAEVSAELALTGPSIFLKPGSQIDIDVVDVGEFGTEPLYIDSEEDLKDHLTHVRSTSVVSQEATNEEGLMEPTTSTVARYYLLDPSYGRAEVPITQVGALDILSTLNVFPEFYRYLSAFGRKTFSQDEGFAGFDRAYVFGPDGCLSRVELCYLLKYVEKRKDSRPGTDPWSPRHALIYQQTDLQNYNSNHILVRIPETAKSRLEEHLLDKGAAEACRFARDWTGLHSLCFGSISGGLRECINYLDQEVTSVFRRLLLSGIEVGKHNEFDDPHSSANDMKTLQHLEDQANRVMNVIELNIETIDCMITHSKKVKKRGHSSDHGMIDDFLEEMEAIRQDHRFSLLNISAVMKRSKAISEQLRDTVAVRNSEMANTHTKAIYKLTEASGQEARVVKTLTVLALFFVPASLVADFLQLGYVKLRDDRGPGWVANPELQIYAALVFPLIAFIILVYGVVEWRSSKLHPSSSSNISVGKV